MITDDLLAVSIRIKRDAGVTHGQVQEVIDRFASQEKWEERTGGIGYPLFEDVPQETRGAFMAALAELMPTPERRDALGALSRSLSANDIWPSRSM
jgi:hypothetical protein